MQKQDPFEEEEGSSRSRVELEDIMATLGRSLKSPGYLARAKRPAMSPRTFSNSSDVSLASHDSGRSDDHLDLIMSGLNTPAQEKTQTEALTSAPRDSFPMPAPRSEPAGAAPKLRPIETSSLQSSRASRSRPIAIELPQIRKFGSGSEPSPLSARGDVPGGYFPHHEDPTTRVHQPHPFRSESGSSRPKPKPAINLPDSPATIVPDHAILSEPAVMPEAAQLRAGTRNPQTAGNTPVASYMPGIGDTSLPMGKYYPSNYERTHGLPSVQPSVQSSVQSSPKARLPRNQSRPGNLAGLSSSTKSDSQIPTVRSHEAPRFDSDAKRKLQQYQRDMIAQARLAANEVLGSANRGNTVSHGTGMLKGVPLRNLHHLGGTGLHKPLSPRLLPLGSPGPVTPMELEGEQGGYLDRGRGSSAFGENDDLARSLRV